MIALACFLKMLCTITLFCVDITISILYLVLCFTLFTILRFCLEAVPLGICTPRFSFSYWEILLVHFFDFLLSKPASPVFYGLIYLVLARVIFCVCYILFALIILAVEYSFQAVIFCEVTLPWSRGIDLVLDYFMHLVLWP